MFQKNNKLLKNLLLFIYNCIIIQISYTHYNIYVYINMGGVFVSAFLIIMSTTLLVTVNGNVTSMELESLSNNLLPGFINRYKFNLVKIISKQRFKLRTPSSLFV